MLHICRSDYVMPGGHSADTYSAAYVMTDRYSTVTLNAYVIIDCVSIDTYMMADIRAAQR